MRMPSANRVPHLLGPWLNQRICFLHVPKCAGTALLNAIKRRYRIADHLRGRVATLDAAVSLRSATRLGVNRHEHRKLLLSYLLADPGKRFASGHVGCNRALLDAYAGEWNFVTVLREPTERWLSEYWYNRHKLSEHNRTDLSLEAYLDDPVGRDYAQTYLNLFGSLPADAPQAERIDEALENLRRLNLIGYTDALPAFIEDFEKRFGVRLSLGPANANPAPSYDSARSPPEPIMERIRERCGADIELYRRFRSGS